MPPLQGVHAGAHGQPSLLPLHRTEGSARWPLGPWAWLHSLSATAQATGGSRQPRTLREPPGNAAPRHWTLLFSGPPRGRGQVRGGPQGRGGTRRPVCGGRPAGALPLVLSAASAPLGSLPPTVLVPEGAPAKHGREPLNCPAPTPRGPSATLEGPLVWSQGVGLEAFWSRTHSSGRAWDRPAALGVNPGTPGHSPKGLLAPHICPFSAHTWGLPTRTADPGCPRWGSSPQDALPLPHGP